MGAFYSTLYSSMRLYAVLWQGRWAITLGQRLASPLLGVIAHGCQIKPVWEAPGQSIASHGIA